MMNEDIELVRRFKAGDETGFDELVRRYQARIHALMFRLVRNQEDAYELAQDVFVRAFRALPKFQEKSSFYTWLYRIGVNLAFNFLRSRKRRQSADGPEVQLDEETMMSIPNDATPPGEYRQQVLRETINRAVETLPDRQRAIFVMRQFDGLRNDEIARVLKCPVGTVKANYFFAVRNLQQTLARHPQPELRTAVEALATENGT
jgi:RNA polymerase sigma-70 factor, ECF subfamily